MADLIRFILVLLVAALLVFLGGARFLSVGGVNPNLILILFCGLIFIPFLKRRVKFGYFVVLLLFSFLVGSFIFDFWLIPWLTLAAVILGIYFLRNFLTGRPLLDFLIGLSFGVVVFYAVLRFFTGGAFLFDFLFWEIVYDLFLGVVLWFLFNLLEKHAR